MTPTCPARFSRLVFPPATRLAGWMLVAVLGYALAPSASAQKPTAVIESVVADTLVADTLVTDALIADTLVADTSAVQPEAWPRPDPTAAVPAGTPADDPLFGAKPEVFGPEWTDAFGPPVVYPDSVATPDPAYARPNPLGPPPRVTLVSRSRPVVLLPGVSRPDAVRRDRTGRDDRQASPITRATIEVGPDGERTVVYSDRSAPPPDVSLALGCGPAADRSLARIRSLAETPLMFTDESPLVGAAQQLLCVAGYPVPQTGIFDEEMERAVTDFQSAHNAASPPENQLLVSGILDEPTRRELAAIVLARLGE